MGPYRGGLHGVVFGWDGWFDCGQGWVSKILAELKNIETFQQLEKMVFLFCAHVHKVFCLTNNCYMPSIRTNLVQQKTKMFILDQPILPS